MPQGIKKGDVLKGRYEIQRQIGKGGMSRIFLAADLQLNNKLWAVKEVNRHATDPAGRPVEQALAKEAEILSRLDHPRIVRIVDTETTADFIYVVMDYVEGESLDKVVRREGPQSEEDVQRWMLDICDTLEYLHSQNPPIIYRDMKPNNIMLHPDGYVKLIDFGVVREYKDQVEVNQDTIAFGTQGYAPPEQYGKSQTDARADVYALGATMWHLLAGEAPPMEFPLRSVLSKNPQVGEGFASVIIPRCTQIKREDRYQSCGELMADLEIYEELTNEYRSKQTKKVKLFAIAAILAVVLAIAGVACLGVRSAMIAGAYETYISLGSDLVQSAQSCVDDPEKRDAYLEQAEEQYLLAIEKVPDAIEAYEGLISCYKVDGQFSVEEKKQFDSVYQQNLSQLQGGSEYAQLAYDVGRLYWTYYSYGQGGDEDSNRAVRVKASAEYFKIAAEKDGFEHHDRAQIYADIAQFTSEIANRVKEGTDDKEFYGTYWDALESLSNRIGSEENELVKLDGCALISNAIETYADKFKNVAGVTRNEMQEVYDNVYEVLSDMDTTHDEYETRRLSIMDRMDNEVTRKISTVYGSN